MRAIKIRILSVIFGILFFFQTHLLLADDAIQFQGIKNLDNSDQSKSFSNYILQPIQSIVRIAAHRSHSSHSSHRSHSSHSSHSSHQSSSYGVSYTVPRTTTYSSPSTSSSPIKTTPEVPAKKSILVPDTTQSSNPEAKQVPSKSSTTTTEVVPIVEPSYSFTIPRKFAIFQYEPDSSKIPARVAWEFLCKRIDEQFTVLLESDVDTQSDQDYNFPDITKAAQAEFYVSGSIIWTGKLYVASLELGNIVGKKIKINKASESLDMLLTSIINSIEQQEDLL